MMSNWPLWSGVDWFNHRRLHSACGLVPPVEFEQQYYRHHIGVEAAVSAQPSLP